MNAPVQPAAPGPIGALFSEHGDFVFRTLQYLGVPASSLDDGLQDVFVTAHRRWDAFEGRSTPRTWLYGIARRVAFRYRRKNENHRRRFVLTERSVEAADVPFEQANARRSVQALLAGLDEDKRASFVLVEVEGFTAAEAAELLEIPLGTVYSRVRAAWARLREAAREEVEHVRLASMRIEMPPERRAGVQRAVAAACVPAAGVGTVAVATTGLGTAAWLWGVAALSVVAVGIGVVLRTAAPAPKPVLASEPTREPTTEAELPALTPPPQAPRSPAEPPAAEAKADAPPTVRPAPVRVPRTNPRAKGPKTSDPPGTLVQELGLIRKAKELVRDGKPDEARTVLEEHARTFADGQLSDERAEILRSLPAPGDDTRAP